MDHTGLVFPERVLHLPGIITYLLADYAHGPCTAGTGRTPASCTMRLQLEEACHTHGWDDLIPPTTAPETATPPSAGNDARRPPDDTDISDR